MRWILAALLISSLLAPCESHGGGPLFVAGASYFDPVVKGTPLVWANNTVTYFTDQGDLSPVLPGPSADALVAATFVHWTGIPTVALTATQAGQLAEDVSGSNVTLAGGVLSLPADIQPDAAGTPVGIVYDQDGQVTDTLLGSGSSADCLNDAVYGGLDNVQPNGNFGHALVILNGTCVQDSSQLADFEYRLVRVLGHVIGLGASQVNLNVWTGAPAPTQDDFAGFPVMHGLDPVNCLPITNCLPVPDQPSMDDRAALGRLYPITPANQFNYSGKIPFSRSTARIRGVVSFPGSPSGPPGQGMQGVNVVARWIDPATRQPSRKYVASAVSGFLYQGNAGNPITGFADAVGQSYDQWGSDDPALQGFFDLAGLEDPSMGFTSAYQLTFERVDPLYSEAVGSYAPLQVDPSGASPAVVVLTYPGIDIEQDVVMANAAVTPANPLNSQDFLNPLAVPGGGEWMSWLNVSGGTNYYSFPAHADRTLSVEVATVDEQGSPTQGKAQPVIGIWSLAAPEGTVPPSATPKPFNTTIKGLTRLDAQVLTASDFRLGISDWRGDGRPDYAHQVRVLYADTINPARASAAGGTALQVQGMGFRPAMTALVGGVAASVVDFGANRLLLQTPPEADGVQTVVVSDPATGGFSTMTDAITVGAGPADTVQLLPVVNPEIPVGGQTQNPLPFLITAPDGTPVAGATVSLAATNGLTLDPCGGAASCSVFSDDSGRVVVNVGATLAGSGQVAAALAPATYANPSTAVATLMATNLNIALVGQLVEVEQGTIVTIPFLARVLGPSGPQPGVLVNFEVATGETGLLGSASVTTDANGNAANTLRLAPVSTDVQVSACLAPAGPCAAFMVGSVPVSALQIVAVSGTQQVVTEGQPVAPVVVLVTDNSVPQIPVFGANVAFLNILSRTTTTSTGVTVNDVIGNANSDPVILGSATTLVTSDINGMASIASWATPVPAGEQVNGLATVDSGAQVAFSLQVLATVSGVTGRIGVSQIVPLSVRERGNAGNPFSQSFGWFGGWLPGFAAWDWGTDKAAQDVVVPKERVGAEDGIPETLIPESALPSVVDPPVFDLPPEAKKSACELCSGSGCALTGAK